MYVFAIAALLGLGVLAVALVVERFIWRATGAEPWALLLGLLGVGAAWLADFSIWAPGTSRCAGTGSA